MSTTKTNDRVAELRAALSQAEADLADARECLGTAIADGDEAQAEAARADGGPAERLADELRSALPVAERRAREAPQAEAQRQQRAREKPANAARKQRLAPAKKVDKLMAQLGRAFAEYQATEPGGTDGDAARLARRSRHAVSAALFNHAPDGPRARTATPPNARPLRAPRRCSGQDGPRVRGRGGRGMSELSLVLLEDAVDVSAGRRAGRDGRGLPRLCR